MIPKIADTVYAVKFIRLMQKSFTEWGAYKHSIIDEKGNLIKLPKTPEEKKAYTPFHASIRAMKRIMNTVPGLNTLATMATTWSAVASRYGLNEHEQEIFDALPLFEEMVAGDSSGDPVAIASGETSGAITNKGPDVIGKTVKRKKKKEDKI
jgi:hypothetical protein